MSAAHAQSDTAYGLAYRMAGYIKDAAYIAAYVRSYHGRTFSVAKIEAMQAEHRRAAEEFARPKAENRVRTKPDNDNGEPFRVRGLVKLKANVPAQPVAVILKKTAIPYRPRATRIVAAVAEAFGITVEELKSVSRARYLVIARGVAMRILRDCHRDGSHAYSLPKIGHLVGRADHSTVVNALDQFDAWMDAYPDAREIYEALKGLAD